MVLRETNIAIADSHSLHCAADFLEKKTNGYLLSGGGRAEGVLLWNSVISFLWGFDCLAGGRGGSGGKSGGSGG